MLWYLDQTISFYDSGNQEFPLPFLQVTQVYSQWYLDSWLFVENIEYDVRGLVTENLMSSVKYPNASAEIKVKLGIFEAKESENIWLRYITPYTVNMKSPFVKNIDVKDLRDKEISIDLLFVFSTNLIDCYEKYPESVVSGLTKIGGLLALFKIVSFTLFYLHRYLFEAHIKT